MTDTQEQTGLLLSKSSLRQESVPDIDFVSSQFRTYPASPHHLRFISIISSSATCCVQRLTLAFSKYPMDFFKRCAYIMWWNLNGLNSSYPLIPVGS
jgi:hypothetical protein